MAVTINIGHNWTCCYHTIHWICSVVPESRMSIVIRWFLDSTNIKWWFQMIFQRILRNGAHAFDPVRFCFYTLVLNIIHYTFNINFLFCFWFSIFKKKANSFSTLTLMFFFPSISFYVFFVFNFTPCLLFILQILV